MQSIVDKHKVELLKLAKFYNDESENDLQKFKKSVDIFCDYLDENNDCLDEILGKLTLIIETISPRLNIISAFLLSLPFKNSFISKEFIINSFDESVFNFINSLNKVADLQTEKAHIQPVYYRTFLVSLADDVRIVLFKIAERLYQLRNLHNYSDNVKLKYVLETNYLYAPLSHRLGLYNIKSEMEDLALAYTHPQEYNNIIKKLKDSDEEREIFIKKFVSPLKPKLDNYNLKYNIKWRTKSVYSIWSKMKKQAVPFEEVFDIFAIRIIISCPEELEKSECWKAYSAVTDVYQPNPDRLRDWISIPRASGYESLHTTVLSPEGNWVEVQIRTERMDEIAEKGPAAHWRYKGGKEDKNIEKRFSEIREIINSNDIDDDDLFETVKFKLYSNNIFVYTPQGDLKKLPTGATVLDFAFDIHSNIGAFAYTAKVNARTVPLKQVLSNGDKVEIITGKNRNVNQAWFKWVKTSKARNAIRKILNEEKFKLAGNGKEIFERKIKNWKINFSDDIINWLLKYYKIKTANDFFQRIAKEEINLTEIKELIDKNEKPISVDETKSNVDEQEFVQKIFSGSSTLEISQAPDNIKYSFAKCCKPIYGDSIIGFISVSGGIKIHRKNCPNINNLIDKYPYRIIEAKWKTNKTDGVFIAQILVSGYDRVGILNDITKLISTELNTNMHSLEIQSKNEMFTGRISLSVNSSDKLELLLKKMLKISGIKSAVRL